MAAFLSAKVSSNNIAVIKTEILFHHSIISPNITKCRSLHNTRVINHQKVEELHICYCYGGMPKIPSL